MTSKKYSSSNPSQLVQDHHRNQVQFTPHQATIQRVSSLRKVQLQVHPFTPDIHDLPFHIYPERTKTQVSRQQIVQRLIEGRRQKAESMRNEKVRRQNQEYSQICTFQPEISYHSKKIAEKDRPTKDTHQRLYSEGLSKIKNTLECTHLPTEEDKENCTFQPNLHREKDHSSNLTPIYQRLEQIVAEKKEYLKKLQGEREREQALSKPSISQVSKQLVEKKSDFKKNVLERLFTYMRDKNDRLEKMAEQKEGIIQKECPFQPSLNYYPQNSQLEEFDFLTRQEIEAERAREKKAILQEMEQAPFHPNINKLSSLLIQAERAEETDQDKIDRLHHEPGLERRAELEKIEGQLYRQCTFQPEINPISKGLEGKPHSHRCQSQPKFENYQFHPSINPKSRELAQKSRPKETGVAVEQARLEMEYKEMKECTFKPKTLGNKFKQNSKKTSLKSIPGALSYQQRVEKVKAKRRDEDQLKEKLFEIHKGYVEHRETKPEPFQLSLGQQRKGKLKEQAEDDFKKQHPFRPCIVEKIR